MAVSKDKKKEIFADLQKIVKENSSVVFVNFHGISMNDTTELRKALHKEGVGYTVAKKTLTKKAFGELPIQGAMPDLVGELAIAYSSDLLAPAREVNTFAKKFENKISILGGVFEGKYMDKAAMVTIAQIPPLQTLRGMFVNIINSPIARFVVSLDQIAQKKV
jgi:large subunit ribosomal protein L10